MGEKDQYHVLRRSQKLSLQGYMSISGSIVRPLTDFPDWLKLMQK